MPAGNSALVDATVAKITEELGEISVVIANAGICHHVDAEVGVLLLSRLNRAETCNPEAHD